MVFLSNVGLSPSHTVFNFLYHHSYTKIPLSIRSVLSMSDLTPSHVAVLATDPAPSTRMALLDTTPETLVM